MRREVMTVGTADRVYQAVIDAFMACIILFVAFAFFGWFQVVLPGFDDFGRGACGDLNCSAYEPESGIGPDAGATYWITLALASGVFLLVSGAFSKARRSPGMIAAGTYPVPAAALGGSEGTPPSAWRMLARWGVVIALFAAGTAVGGNGIWGVLAVLLAWVPSLFGARTALYDWLTGTLVAQVRYVNEMDRRTLESWPL